MDTVSRIRSAVGRNLIRVTLTLVLVIVYGTFSEYYLEHGAQGSGIRNLFDSLWFVVQTITTVGYGDTHIATFLGRVNAIAFMLVGIGILGFFTASWASSFIQYSIGKRSGEILLKAKGHIVLCNWNSLTPDIAQALLREKTNLILLAPVEKKPVEGLEFFQGTCLHLSDLESVSTKDAGSVIIMAEKLWDKELASAIDAKTIIGIMNVRKINPRAHIVAELLKSDSVDNARLAGANELVVHGEMSARLIARAALYPSTIDMMKTMLSSSSDQQIFVDVVPSSMKGRKDGDLLNIIIERDCIAIAIKRAKEILVNPHKDLVLGDDSVVYIGKSRLNFR